MPNLEHRRAENIETFLFTDFVEVTRKMLLSKTLRSYKTKRPELLLHLIILIWKYNFITRSMHSESLESFSSMENALINSYLASNKGPRHWQIIPFIIYKCLSFSSEIVLQQMRRVYRSALIKLVPTKSSTIKNN